MPDGLVRVNDTHASAGPEAPKSVLERVFALLDCFTADEPMLTLAQMAARTGIPRSTSQRSAGSSGGRLAWYRSAASLARSA